VAEHVIRGKLDVQLGGKNMTFFQRVTGTVIGECPGAGHPTEERVLGLAVH
jgi:hypothetical protein